MRPICEMTEPEVRKLLAERNHEITVLERSLDLCADRTSAVKSRLDACNQHAALLYEIVKLHVEEKAGPLSIEWLTAWQQRFRKLVLDEKDE